MIPLNYNRLSVAQLACCQRIGPRYISSTHETRASGVDQIAESAWALTLAANPVIITHTQPRVVFVFITNH